ncbi:MAG: peptidylprolyl isomerase SurA [Sodalis sp. (in: enterobacteria)]
MKNWRTFILGLSLCVNSALASPQVVDKIAVVVNNDIILESDVSNLLRTVKRGAQRTNQQLPNNTTLRRQILDRLIMNNIILQLAQRTNITISDKQLDQTISNIAAQNHVSLEQLRSRLVYEGIDYHTYRTQIRKEMLIAEAYNSEVRNRVTILPQEVDSLAQKIAAQTGNSAEVNLSHILIPLRENPTQKRLDKAKALANSLVEKSKIGKNFDKLAITYSSDTQTLKSGQIGWAKLEELPSLLAAHLRSAQKGSIVGPIHSGVGFHILKVNDIRSDDQKITVTEVYARHIFLGTSVVMTDQQARAKLEDVSAQIKSGRISFSDAARQLSEDPGSANQGGDLGWRSADTFDPAFRNALMHLKQGEISAPVHSFFGWHLIQLIDTRQVDHTDATQKERAYQLLFERKFAEEGQTWMEEQRASAYVKIIENNVQ